MQISVTELVTVLVIYTAMAGSGLYWLWHRALTRPRPARRGPPRCSSCRSRPSSCWASCGRAGRSADRAAPSGGAR